MAPSVKAKRGTYWPISCPLLAEPHFGRHPHPSPHNPTRDDLASTRATWLDVTRTPLSAARGRRVTLMWRRYMTEWILWHSCLCTWNAVGRRESGGDAERCDIRHSTSICLYFSHLQVHAWNSLKGTRVWLKTLQIFAGLIRPVNKTFNRRNRLREGCACVKLYYLGEGEMFFESLFFSLFIRPSLKKRKKVVFFLFQKGR